MSVSRDSEKIFHYFKCTCSWISGILMVWLFFHLFFRSVGGPFPQRTRGPFARQEYVRLGNMPDWESVINQSTEDGRTLSELLNDGESIPELQFGQPPVTPQPAPHPPSQ